MKKIIGNTIIIIIIASVGVAYAGYFLLKPNAYVSEPKDTATASSTPVNKADVVKAMIDRLQAEREQNPTFIAETLRMEKELDAEIARMRQALKDNRKAQSRLDALMIVRTQYEVELYDLEKANQI